MKELIKKLLSLVRLYHPLQSSYYLTSVFLYSIFLKWRYSRKKGNHLICNICQSSYSSFAPKYPKKNDTQALSQNHVIAGFGENIICPNCMSTARERLVVAMLKKYFDVGNKKVLLLSPEKKVFNFLKTKSDIITGDLNPGFYRHIDSKISKIDLLSLPFADAIFDIFIGNHILEHIPDDRTAMREVYRVLKYGGKVVMQVPFSESLPNTIEQSGINSPSIQSKLFGQSDHVRIYALSDYILRLQDTGFDVNLITYSELSDYYINAIQPGEHFILISKPFKA